MQDMPNPYAAQDHAADSSPLPISGSHDGRMVPQVAIIGILQIVQGALELLMGGILITFAYWMDAMLKMQPPGEAPPPEAMTDMARGMYLVLGGLIASLALLRIFSGIASFWFRGRVWTIVSLFAGLLSAFTCYCAPFSIGLCIYGLIVLFNPGVARAYEMASRGRSAAEIKRYFASPEYR